MSFVLFNFQGPCRPLSALRFVRRLVYSITLLRFCQVLFSISLKFFFIFFLQKSFLVIASVRQLCYNITLPYPLSTLFFDFFGGFTSCILWQIRISVFITFCNSFNKIIQLLAERFPDYSGRDASSIVVLCRERAFSIIRDVTK